MLVGGLRALLVQALEPRAMAAVDQHSKFREDPWGRLERTTNFVVATTYGDTATAEAAAARIRKVHEHIHGIDSVTGLPYAANDPDLLLWIHAVEMESFLLAYRTYAGRVSEDDADRYVSEMPPVAELATLPDGPPRRPSELHEYHQAPVRGLQTHDTRPFEGCVVMFRPWTCGTARCGRSPPPLRSPSCPGTPAACTDPVVPTGHAAGAHRGC
jgi:uncharacterized protein (DUF2236 family)